jgi:hypothetical protein
MWRILLEDVYTTIFWRRKSRYPHNFTSRIRKGDLPRMQVCMNMKRAWALSGWRDPPIALWSNWDVFRVWNKLLSVACLAVSEYRLLTLHYVPQGPSSENFVCGCAMHSHLKILWHTLAARGFSFIRQRNRVSQVEPPPNSPLFLSSHLVFFLLLFFFLIYLF